MQTSMQSDDNTSHDPLCQLVS